MPQSSKIANWVRPLKRPSGKHPRRMDLFDPAVSADTPRGRRLNAKAPPKHAYLVLFTPRSGSSWLSDLLRNTGAMGDPGEMYNPEHVKVMARQLASPDLETYIRRVTRHRTRNGVFGAKVAPDHCYQALGGVAEFLAVYPEAALFWLIREDIVAQAVSVYMMRFRKTNHNIAGQDTGIIREPVYDADEIGKCLLRMLRLEEMAEVALKSEPRRVVRLSQERMLASDPQRLVNMMRRHIGLPDIDTGLNVESGHEKIGTSLNAEFAERFHADNPSGIAEAAAVRRDRLDLLDRL